MRPSVRRLVPSSEERTPPFALGVPELVTGGQYFAHMPLHVLLEPLSWAQMYSVMPLELVRTEPSLVDPVLIAARWEPAADADVARTDTAASATRRTRVNRMWNEPS